MISFFPIRDRIRRFRGWGKVLGTLLGGLSGMGVFGAALGLAVGHLADVILFERNVTQLCIHFVGGSEEGTIPKQWRILSSLAGAVAFSLYPTQRPIPALFRDALQRHFSVGNRQAAAVYTLVTSLDQEGAVEIDFVCRQLLTFQEYARPEQIVELIFLSVPLGVLPPGSSAVERAFVIAEALGMSENEFREIRDRFVSADVSAYEILGVRQTSSWNEIKGTFRKLAASFHPDTGWALSHRQKEEIEEAFKRIVDAYDRIKLERGKS